MDILIRGSSAAAHALTWKLAESRASEHLYCLTGNAGTQALCEPYDGQVYTYAVDTYSAAEEASYAVCGVSDGRKAFLFPAVKIEDHFSFVDPEAVLPSFPLPAQQGFYTLEYAEDGTILRLVHGLSGPAACLSLAILKGDLTALLGKMEAGFPDDFSLEFRDGTAALFAAKGENGAKIVGLADLPGDIGVFINAAERADDHLRVTGSPALYLCARDKSIELCRQKLEKAEKLICFTPDFRPMRRFKQQTDRETCVRILKTEKRGVLAVHGENGYPYAIPVDFYFDEASDTVYLHGARQGHKIDAIKADDRVCFSVWNQGEQIEDWSYHVISVVGFGHAHLVQDEAEKRMYAVKLGNKYYPSAEEVEIEIAKDLGRAAMIAVKLEHITGKRVHEK